MSKEDDAAGAYSWLDDYDTIAEPFKDGYSFTEENPLKETPNAFEEGLKKLEEGDIPSAVLLFEAACQQEPENVQAWQYLGTTQAKNEHDPAAICALKKTLELDQTNLAAWQALAVSYTNESLQRQACDALGEWIRRNPKYADMVANSFVEQPSVEEGSKIPAVSSIVTSTHFNQTRDAFIKAARAFPETNIDADVQCGLGVLFNLSGEYAKATDCFRAALQARPDDALLWNRLGATLANGSQSEEAVAAYRQALERSPGFIRSRFNLGISCINLGAHREAAEHFLAVLNLQNAGRGPKGASSRTAMSNNVWTSLRMCLSLMGRQDMYGALERRDLAALNTEFAMNEYSS
jgi:peroxin-5